MGKTSSAMASAIATQAANQILETEEEQLAHKKIFEFQSSLEILKKRHGLEKSDLTQFAEWYGAKPRAAQLRLAAIIIAVSAVIGVLSGLTTLFVLSTGGIYYFGHQLLKGHINITRKQEERFCSDILSQETQFKSFVESISSMEDQAQEALNGMRKNNSALSKEIEILQNQVTEFQAAKTTLAQELQVQKDDLRLATEHLDHEARELRELSGGLSKTAAEFDASIKQLASMEEGFQAHNQSLSKMNAILTRKVGFFAGTQSEELSNQVDSILQQTANFEEIIRQSAANMRRIRASNSKPQSFSAGG